MAWCSPRAERMSYRPIATGRAGQLWHRRSHSFGDERGFQMRGTMIHSRPVPWWTALLMVGLLLALRTAPLLQYAPAWPRDSETAASWISTTRPALPRGEVLADGTLRLGSQEARGELRLISEIGRA